MGIKIDAGGRTYLAYCTACYWRVIRSSLENARVAGALHEERSHTGDDTARDALNAIRRRQRHAAKKA